MPPPLPRGQHSVAQPPKGRESVLVRLVEREFEEGCSRWGRSLRLQEACKRDSIKLPQRLRWPPGSGRVSDLRQHGRDVLLPEAGQSQLPLSGSEHQGHGGEIHVATGQNLNSVSAELVRLSQSGRKEGVERETEEPNV